MFCGKPCCIAAADFEIIENIDVENTETINTDDLVNDEIRNRNRLFIYQAALKASRRAHDFDVNFLVKSKIDTEIREKKFRDALTNIFAIKRESNQLKVTLQEANANVIELTSKLEKVTSMSLIPSGHYHSANRFDNADDNFHPEGYDDLCSTASKSFKKKNYSNCVENLQEAISLNPPLPAKFDLFFNLGLAFMRLKNMNESFHCYVESTAIAKELYSTDQLRYRTHFIDSLQQLVKVQWLSIKKLEQTMYTMRSELQHAASKDQDTQLSEDNCRTAAEHTHDTPESMHPRESRVNSFPSKSTTATANTSSPGKPRSKSDGTALVPVQQQVAAEQRLVADGALPTRSPRKAASHSSARDFDIVGAFLEGVDSMTHNKV